MRDAAATARDVHRMQVWAGQAAALAGAEPAGELVVRLWQEAGSFAAGQLSPDFSGAYWPYWIDVPRRCFST